MAVSAPPKKKPAALPAEPQPAKASEKKIEAIINRGSSTVSKAEPLEPEKPKNFNILLMPSQIETITALRGKRPRKLNSPKLGISLHDWILEAIDNQIEREKKKYGIS